MASNYEILGKISLRIIKWLYWLYFDEYSRSSGAAIKNSSPTLNNLILITIDAQTANNFTYFKGKLLRRPFCVALE